MKFRHSLLLGMLLLLSVALAASLVAAMVVIDRAAHDDVSAQLERSMKVFEELQGFRHALLKSESQMLAEEPRLKAVAATEDATVETVQGVLADLKRALASDVLLVTDPKGKIIAEAGKADAQGHKLNGNAVILAALNGKDGSGIWVDDRLVYQVQARPLTFGSTVVGALLLGDRLDDTVLNSTFRQTGSSVAVELDGAVVAASTFAQVTNLDRVELARGASAVMVGASAVEVQLFDQRYLAKAALLPGYRGQASVRYVVFRSLDEAFGPARSLMAALALIALLSAFLALGVAAVLSARLSNPLAELEAFARRIGGGEMQARAKVEGPLEVQSLGQTLNAMVDELDEGRKVKVAKARLDQELEIAHSIQTALLPKSLEVVGLEISAHMRPAAEVGGDYYDIRPVKGGAWFGIGDVAGHGLPAGLIMMMVQNVVAALVRSTPDASPGALVSMLNEILFENVRSRLGRTEHVTLCLVRFYREGRLVFAGAHEPLIICRPTGKAEQLSTPGTWLGAMKEIQRFTKDTEATVNVGDVVVLYSDGITEAKNASGAQFGIERLCSAIEEVRTLPAAQVSDYVFRQLERWTETPQDDVTLVVFRVQKI